MESKDSEKKDRLMSALDRGMVMIHLDARRPGVLVPAHLRNEAHLRLNLSYRFDPPDLSVGEWGVRSTLTFHGTRFTVAIPWSALFAITSYVTREFWLYPDEMPREVTEHVKVTEKASIPEEAIPRPRVALREVAPLPEDLPPQEAIEEAPKPRPRPHLRLVK